MPQPDLWGCEWNEEPVGARVPDVRVGAFAAPREIICPVEAQELEAARRELAELYKRLEFVRPLSRDRIRIQMQITRVKKRITELERAG